MEVEGKELLVPYEAGGHAHGELIRVRRKELCAYVLSVARANGWNCKIADALAMFCARLFWLKS